MFSWFLQGTLQNWNSIQNQNDARNFKKMETKTDKTDYTTDSHSRKLQIGRMLLSINSKFEIAIIRIKKYAVVTGLISSANGGAL